jgi:cell division initiation protein
MPIDIENKVFKKSKFGGYDIDDVESFLELLIVDYESLYKQNFELKQKLDLATDSLTYYSELEDGVARTIENTEREADCIKEKAIEEANSILEKAKMESTTTIEEIKLEIRAKEIELEQIKKQMQIYKIKTKSMLEAQLQILNDEE